MIDWLLEGKPQPFTQDQIDRFARPGLEAAISRVLDKRHANTFERVCGIISYQLLTELQSKGVRITIWSRPTSKRTSCIYLISPQAYF